MWVERQLECEQVQDENTEKLIKPTERKIAQTKAKIGRVQQGYDDGIYSLEEAKQRLGEYNKAITGAEGEKLGPIPKPIARPRSKLLRRTETRISMKQCLLKRRTSSLNSAFRFILLRT